MQSSLKFYPHLNLYKCSNLEYDPVKQVAHSYEWYEIYKVIKGIRVLNTYNYSVTTCKHIAKLWSFFSYADEILAIEAPKGLQDLSAAIKHYENKREALLAETLKPRTNKLKNIKRIDQAREYLVLIEKIKELL